MAPLNPDAVMTGLRTVAHDTPERPAVLRVTVRGYDEVHRWTEYGAGAHLGRFGSADPNAMIPDYFDPRHEVLGLAMEIGEHYPEGVWRLLSPEGDLMYDPRQGHTLADILRGRYPGGYGMNELQPTPERIAAAKRAQSREWTIGPEGAGEIMRDDVVGHMVVAGLIEPRFVTPTQQIAGRSDYLVLTVRGEEWLARAEQ